MRMRRKISIFFAFACAGSFVILFTSFPFDPSFTVSSLVEYPPPAHDELYARFCNHSIFPSSIFPPHDYVYSDSATQSWVTSLWCYYRKQNPHAPPFVALTFDDGPSERSTAKILQILRNANAHATFFLLGHQLKKARYLPLAQQVGIGFCASFDAHSDCC